jgi:uncharacterized protein (DUF697 family)
MANLEDNRTATAHQITRKYALWAAGASFIPLPFVDVAAITGLQAKMLAELSHHYGHSFEARHAKSAIVGLLGSTSLYGMFHGVPGTVIRAIPMVNLFAVLSRPVIASAITYGLGSVFVTHFERGGTLETFEPESGEVQKSFQEAVARGKRELQGSTASKQGAPA